MFRIVSTLCIGKTMTCDSAFRIPGFRVARSLSWGAHKSHICLSCVELEDTDFFSAIQGSNLIALAMVTLSFRDRSIALSFLPVVAPPNSFLAT